MNFDPTKAPHIADDNWLAEAIVAKLGKENLLNFGPATYVFEGSWRCFDDLTLRNLVRTQIALLNEVRAEARLKPSSITANRVNSVASLLKMSVHKYGLRFNQGPPDTVGCANGDVTFRDGTWLLQPPRHEDYRICRIPHAYDPDAKAPRFAQFLQEVFAPDDDGEQKAEFLLQMMGYALMTHCQHERFLIAIGNGANGKSVALNVIGELVGTQNAAAVHPSYLKNNHHRAELNQKLVNIITESEQGGKLPAAELKALVSGEVMTVDRKHKDPFEMHPFATILWATNHMPHPSDYSDALFRRAGIMTFNRTFAEHERDRQLMLTLRNEMAGILKMALEAYGRAVTSGFAEPPSSIEAKKEWRKQSDAIALWLADCELADGAELKASACFDAFRQWCEHAQLQKLTIKSFSQRLERLGINKRRTSEGIVYVGIKIAAAEVSFS